METSKDLMKSAEAVFENLRTGKIKVDEAKAMGAQIRTAAKVVALELEMAKMSGVTPRDGKLSSIKLV